MNMSEVKVKTKKVYLKFVAKMNRYKKAIKENSPNKGL